SRSIIMEGKKPITISYVVPIGACSQTIISRCNGVKGKPVQIRHGPATVNWRLLQQATVPCYSSGMGRRSSHIHESGNLPIWPSLVHPSGNKDPAKSKLHL